jgi:hypothetical protein
MGAGSGVIAVLSMLVAVVAFGLWLAAESSAVVAYAPQGPLGQGWRWEITCAPGRFLARTLLYGFLFCAAASGGEAARHFIRKKHLALVAWRGLGQPAAILASVEIATLCMQWGSDGRWSVAATISLLAVGRLCAGAVLWEAAGVATLVRWTMRFLDRHYRSALVVLLALPVCFAPWIKVDISGDEPSYLFFSASMLRDGDLRFPPDEIQALNKEFGLGQDHLPHITEHPGGRQSLRHYIGPSLVVMPVLFVADLFHLRMVPLCHGLMLIICGVTLSLSALFAARMTGRWGASLLAAALIGISFPVLGMSYQLYPDPMVAPLVLGALLFLVPALKGRTALSTRASGWILVICCLLPWFHSKYGALSAVLGLLAVVFHGALTLPAIATLLSIVVCGAGAFLLVNVPILGDFLWKQASPDYRPLTGIVAMFADGHSGLLPYAPWVLALPCGALAMRRHGGIWRLPLTIMLLTVALWVPTGTLCWEGLASVLRYLTPIVVTWSPFLAAAFLCLRSRQLYVLMLLCFIPVLAAQVFLDDPMTGYMVLVQGMRRIPDEMINAFSWRELYPHYRWTNQGIDVPGALSQGLWVFVLAAAASAALAYARRSSWLPLSVLALAAVAAAGLGRVYDSPHWTVTATRMFARQCKYLARSFAPGASDADGLKAGRVRVVRLQLPAAVKPIERDGGAQTDARLWLKFPQGKGGDWLARGPEVRLPAGKYRFNVRGALRNEDPNVTATLEVHVSGIERIEPRVFRCDVSPRSKVMPGGDPNGAVLVSGKFAPKRRTGKVQFHLHRVGPLDIVYSRLEIECAP